MLFKTYKILKKKKKYLKIIKGVDLDDNCLLLCKHGLVSFNNTTTQVYIIIHCFYISSLSGSVLKMPEWTLDVLFSKKTQHIILLFSISKMYAKVYTFNYPSHISYPCTTYRCCNFYYMWCVPKPYFSNMKLLNNLCLCLTMQCWKMINYYKYTTYLYVQCVKQ